MTRACADVGRAGCERFFVKLWNTYRVPLQTQFVGYEAEQCAQPLTCLNNWPAFFKALLQLLMAPRY